MKVNALEILFALQSKVKLISECAIWHNALLFGEENQKEVESVGRWRKYSHSFVHNWPDFICIGMIPKTQVKNQYKIPFYK